MEATVEKISSPKLPRHEGEAKIHRDITPLNGLWKPCKKTMVMSGKRKHSKVVKRMRNDKDGEGKSANFRRRRSYRRRMTS
ncbi:hypothetical protein V6N13_041295 [Hibiscus sabdariffa]